MANTPFNVRNGLNVNNFVVINSTAIAVASNLTINTSTLFVGNTTANLLANSIFLSISNATAVLNLSPIGFAAGNAVLNTTAFALGNLAGNTTAFAIGANVLFTQVLISVGNSVANLLANSVIVSLANATATLNLQPTQIVLGSATVNTTAFVSGANVFFDTTKVSVGNSTANLLANSILISLANATATLNLQPTQIVLGSVTINTTALLHGANVFLDTVKLSVGNSTANLLANSILVSLANSSGIANLQPTQLVIASSVINATAYAAGANVFLDVTKLLVGNSTANLLANSILISLANATATLNLQPTQLVLGSVTINTTAHLAGANVFFDTVKLSVGNTTANLLANSIILKLANATAITNVSPDGLIIGTSVVNTAGFFGNGASVTSVNAFALAGANLGTSANFLANTASKVLVTDQVWGAAAPVTITFATTVPVDLSTGINFVVTMTANAVFANATNAKAGQSGVILIKQDGTGSRLGTFQSAWKFPGGTAPTLTTTASAVDKLYYLVESASIIHAALEKDSK